MDATRLASLALASGALAAIGCGSSKPSDGTPTPVAGTRSSASQIATKPASPLSPARLIAEGDAICYRLHARRTSIRIARPQDYERLVPALAAYELTGATEMSNLTPPPSMAHDWQQMVIGTRIIAQATARIRNYAKASSKAFSEALEPVLYKGVNQLTAAAKHAGFKDCSRFP